MFQDSFRFDSLLRFGNACGRSKQLQNTVLYGSICTHAGPDGLHQSSENHYFYNCWNFWRLDLILSFFKFAPRSLQHLLRVGPTIPKANMTIITEPKVCEFDLPTHSNLLWS